MLEVLHRSQAARVCNLDIGGAALQSPLVIRYLREGHALPSADEKSTEGTLNVEGTERVIGFLGSEVREGSRILPPFSSHVTEVPREFAELDGVSMVRVPLSEDLSSLKDKEIIILENAFELRNDPCKAVDSIMKLRAEAGNLPLIYAPGMADPSNLALLCYMGLDIFDDSLPHFKARFGVATTTAGEVSCSDEGLSRINSEEMEREMALVREFIIKGRLRELVDVRVPSSPWSVAALRLFDDMGHEWTERLTPVTGTRMSCNTTQSLRRPEVVRFRNKVRDEYHPPEHKRVLVLLPCSARKPYSSSKSHKLFSSAIRTGDHDTLVHEVIVTSPLGIVPRELENFYPANAYDIPVTGEWKCEEKAFIRDLLETILEHGYDHVVSHLGKGYEFIQDMAEMTDTVVGDPTSPASLALLDRTLREKTDGMEAVPYQIDRYNTMMCILRHQFGDSADVIMEGAYITGKYPYWKIFRDKVQMGMLTPERGMVSLTLDGGERLMVSGRKRVQIQDFEMKGNLFAVGVLDADESIRIGDEVVVCHGDEVRGVGVALMPGQDMPLLMRGIAVKMRHRKK